MLSGAVELPFQNEQAMKAAEIFRFLRSTGQAIEFRDIFIAATALTYGFPVKTLNVNYFNRVPGLVVA